MALNFELIIFLFTTAITYAYECISLSGYGNIAPETMWGKVIVMVYALLGIPLCLLCLANVGDWLVDMTKGSVC